MKTPFACAFLVALVAISLPASAGPFDRSLSAAPHEGLAALPTAGSPSGTTPFPSPQPPATSPPSQPSPPGFADQVRKAFGNDLVVAGIGGLVAVVLGAAGFSLVTRYVTPKEALKNPQRSMLYGFVRGNPGVHLKKLSEEFNMKTSSILWHMRKLEAAELVHTDRANGFRVFFPTEGGVEMRKLSRAITALQNANGLKLFETIDRHPGQTPADLAAAVGIHTGTVRWHVRKLRDFGLVEQVVGDESSRVFGTALGRKALHSVQGIPVQPQPPVRPVAEVLAGPVAQRE